jgi:hypothetical protein
MGLPLDWPVAGRRYIVVDTYEMPYGLGCTLEGMDHAPYRGYFLHRRGKGKLSGWWFKEVDVGLEIAEAALRGQKGKLK